MSDAEIEAEQRYAEDPDFHDLFTCNYASAPGFARCGPQRRSIFTREGQQFARWKDAKGKTRKAIVTTGANGTPRLLIESVEDLVADDAAKLRYGSGKTLRWRKWTLTATAFPRLVAGFSGGPLRQGLSIAWSRYRPSAVGAGAGQISPRGRRVN